MNDEKDNLEESDFLDWEGNIEKWHLLERVERDKDKPVKPNNLLKIYRTRIRDKIQKEKDRKEREKLELEESSIVKIYRDRMRKKQEKD